VLPEPLSRYEWLAWPLVVLTTLAGALVAVRDRFKDRERKRVSPNQESLPPAELPPDIREFTDWRRELARLTQLVS
jgi:hypothetical protein